MNLAQTDADKRTAELVKLAQRELHGDPVLSDDAGFARLQGREVAPRARWAKGLVMGSVGLASAGALAALLLWHSQPPRLTYEVAGGVAQDGRVVAREGTRIRFSDGSEARLTSGTEAHIENVTEHGADVVLTRGSMNVHIAKKPRASWKVAAGPYNVRVTGTAFDVSWSNQAQTFDLRMETGAVIVTGPLAVSGIPLKAGQHLFSGLAEGRLTVEGGDAAKVAAPQAATPSADAATETPTPGPVHAAPSSAARAAVEAHAWTREVAQGHFNVVLEAAEQRGLERTLSSGSLEELSALADAARYSGRSSVAKRVLVAERQRFFGSAAARDAAFFLGRIAEDNGGGASEWYQRYLEESPRGAYASQALGRQMMLLYQQRGRAAAEPVALEYLSRYPNGPYAAAARKIDQEHPPATKP